MFDGLYKRSSSFLLFCFSSCNRTKLVAAEAQYAVLGYIGNTTRYLAAIPCQRYGWSLDIFASRLVGLSDDNFLNYCNNLVDDTTKQTASLQFENILTLCNGSLTFSDLHFSLSTQDIIFLIIELATR
jgi:hypothetical protein